MPTMAADRYTRLLRKAAGAVVLLAGVGLLVSRLAPHMA
jgi:hypothetical protein